LVSTIIKIQSLYDKYVQQLSRSNLSFINIALKREPAGGCSITFPFSYLQIRSSFTFPSTFFLTIFGFNNEQDSGLYSVSTKDRVFILSTRKNKSSLYYKANTLLLYSISILRNIDSYLPFVLKEIK
jgi:hypothetical protein